MILVVDCIYLFSNELEFPGGYFDGGNRNNILCENGKEGSFGETWTCLWGVENLGKTISISSISM